MKTDIIRTKGLTKAFGNEKLAPPFIHQLDLTIWKGEFTVIMGNSGAGKSTLLYLLSGLDNADSGEIWVDNMPIHGRTEKELAIFRRNNIGFVFQDNNLVPNLTIRENILIAGYLRTVDRKLLNRKVNVLLEELDILPLANRMPSQASGGELQRCAIARALINNPTVVLADEPTGNLNSMSALKVLECLSRLHRSGQSIVMVTHDPRSASRGDRVLFFKDGKIVGERLQQNMQNLQKGEEDMIWWLKEQGW